MKRIMISAMSSGSGKTTVTCALLRALSKRGLQMEGFKCGPDYIDPMFQRRVLGIPCRNLDIFLQGEKGVLRTLAGQKGEVAVLEGAMGLFDGINGTEKDSAYHVATLTDTPIILVIKPSGVGLTLAAQVKGMQEFRKPNLIAGIILNDCKKSLFHYLKDLLERECHIPVLGYLPKIQEAAFESRHLGLVTADEISDFDQRMDALAEALEKECDLTALLKLCREGRVCDDQKIGSKAVQKIEEKKSSDGVSLKQEGNFSDNPKDLHQSGERRLNEAQCRIAIARDEAFCFYYEENIEALINAGAEIIYFSPLRDKEVPEAEGIYLGGGYPELYIKELSENVSMMESIRKCHAKGMPLFAECGGFLSLQKTLGGEKMAGILPGDGFKTDHLQRFGYVTLSAEKDSLLFKAGEKIPAHEFHYWDSTDNGSDLYAEKLNGRNWKCAFCTENMYAGFPHLHFGGELPLAERFVQAAVKYKKGKI